MKDSNAKNRRQEAAEIHYTRIGGSWPDPGKQEIFLECPPGEPRPGDLMPALVKGTGLLLQEDVGPALRTLDVGLHDIPRDVWECCGPAYRAANGTAFQCGHHTRRGMLRIYV
jgi:hypothetical protein